MKMCIYIKFLLFYLDINHTFRKTFDSFEKIRIGYVRTSI